MKVICDQRNFCEESVFCGGAKPHEHDESECSQCPKIKEAKCVELVCVDCGNQMPIPFDCGDLEMRCAGCAVDYYMKQPGATLLFNGRDILADQTS